MPGRIWSEFLKKQDPMSIYAHIRYDTRLIPGTKEISTPTLEKTSKLNLIFK
jgi:hypothetical protein